MRKRMIVTIPQVAPETEADWLALEEIAAVEVTSEDSAHPIENALLRGAVEPGWRAALPGEQTVRLVFDHPQSLKRVQLLFIEQERERSQEFVLRWSPDDGRHFQEIVRQQWNFSPHGSMEEAEDYRAELSGVTQLELHIAPDRSGGDACATLARLRVA
jgi:hypothetical protein